MVRRKLDAECVAEARTANHGEPPRLLLQDVGNARRCNKAPHQDQVVLGASAGACDDGARTDRAGGQHRPGQQRGGLIAAAGEARTQLHGAQG